MNIKNKTFFLSGTILAASIMGANVVNLIFNTYLGRVISPEDFGVLALINTFMYFGGLFYNAVAGVTNREVAFLDNSPNSKAGSIFFVSLTKQLFIVNIILAIIWALAVPFTAGFFHIPDPTIFYLFTPLFILYPLAFLGRGYLQGKLLFVLTGVTIIIEPVIKLVSAYFLISLSLAGLIYLSIYISAILTGIITFALAWNKKPASVAKTSAPFPFAFFVAALLTGISSISFLALDMILVKHYLPPVEAGQYALLSLLGKIIFFSGSLLNVFTISIVSLEATGKKNGLVSFYTLLALSAALCTIGVIALGIFGGFTIPLMFGTKAQAIIPLALPYTIALTLFTLGSTLVTYHLAKKEYLFTYLSVAMAVVLTLGIIFYHGFLTQIIYILLIVGFVYSLALIIAHIYKGHLTPGKIAISKIQQNIEEPLL